MIKFIVDNNSSKDSKDIGKMSKAPWNKFKDKEATDIESLTKTIKYLSNELVHLKERTSETIVTNKPPNFNFLRRNNNNNISNHPAKFAQRLNVVLDVETMGMDQYNSFEK